MEARKLLICGTRTYAEEISDIASDIPGVEVVGFVENWERDRCKDTLEGLPIHWVDDLPKVAKGCVAICAIMAVMPLSKPACASTSFESVAPR